MPCTQRSERLFLAGVGSLCLASVFYPAAGHCSEGVQAEVRQHFAQAVDATQHRDFARAEEEYRKALDLDPGSAQALSNLGMVYYLEHKYPQAEEVLVKALKIDSSLVNARVLLGSTYWREGQTKRAVAELEPLLKIRLGNSAEKEVRTALHGAYFAEEKYGQALEALKPLAEKYPRDVDVLYSLGQTYLELAQQSFLTMAVVDPQSYRVHQILADAFAKKARYHDALGEYQQVLQLRPDLPGIHYQIGLLYWLNQLDRAGEDAAIHEFEEELKINPYDPWSQYRLGQIDRKRHEMQSEFAHFLRALEIDPNFIPAHVALARDLEDQGKVLEAQRHLEIVRQLEPDNFMVHFRLARILAKLGDQSGAAKEMAKFLELKGRQQAAEQALQDVIRSAAQPRVDTLDEPDK